MGNVHEATVVDIRALARGVVEWRLRLPEPLHFRPGQFISVRVGEEDGAAVLRSYSIASSPGRPEISLILKLVEGGPGSRFFSLLKLGDAIRFTGPMGFFVNELAHAGDAIYAATGVGITPVLPMVRELLERPNETGQILLYWGNRQREDLFWQDELAELEERHPRFRVRWFLSQEAHDWAGERGRITAAVLADLASFQRPTYYLVGNGAMIRELKAGLQERGVDRKRQIRNEAFFD
jgi:ferredoxin-NADP reductase